MYSQSFFPHPELKEFAVQSSEASVNRDNWKQISKTNRSAVPTFEEICKPGMNPFEGTVYYVLFRNEPYCIFEGLVYSMLPVVEPSLGYKLISAAIDRSTILARSDGITEDQAIAVLFALLDAQNAQKNFTNAHPELKA